MKYHKIQQQYFFFRYVVVVVVMLQSSPLICQNVDSLWVQQIEEIWLIGNRSKQHLSWSQHSDTAKIIDIFQNSTRNLFDRQVGIQAFNGENFAQDVRISIRGFGSRSAFGIRGIRLYQDGIPLTSPDGTTQLDELSIFDISALDIMRSGSAARFGNASGGTITMKSSPFFDGIIANGMYNTLGAYDAGVKLGIQKSHFKNVFSVNHHYFEGKRDFASSKNTTFYNKSRVEFSDNWHLDIIGGIYFSPIGQDPGALTESEYIQNRYQANSRNVLFDAGESVHGGLAAIKSVVSVSKKSTLVSSAFYRIRDFEGRLPFKTGGWIDLERRFGGMSHLYELRLSENTILSLGQSIEIQGDRRTLSENNNGIQGVNTADQDENVLNVGMYQQMQMKILGIHVHQLVRFDYNNYTVKDYYTIDGIQDGERVFKRWNGAIGVNYPISDNIEFFTQVTTSYEMPTLNELSNNPALTGGFNVNLAPESAVHFEVGSRWKPSNNFNISMAVYHINLTDQIIGYEIVSTPGRTYYRNAGRTARNGMEFSSVYTPKPSTEISFNYTYSHFVFKEYLSSGNDYQGNFQPLVPKHKLNLTVVSPLRDLLVTNINLGYSSNFFLDDANKAGTNGIYELNVAIYTGKKIFHRLSLGITLKNVFGLLEYSNFRANAAAQRYYEASSPMSFGVLGRYNFIR